MSKLRDIRRWPAAFGRFWWDFLIGDTPELFVGGVVAVAGVALLAHNGVARAVSVGSLPVLVIALLGASVQRAQRAQRTRGVPGASESSDAPGSSGSE